jgi:muramoyltetrapeptide carboxypeptidase
MFRAGFCYNNIMNIPEKLKKGDLVKMIAPARSMGILSDEIKNIATTNIEAIGLRVSFGKNTQEIDEFCSSSIQSRIDDLHDAFRDSEVKCILSVIGGFNSNQLLKYIDWELVKNNPKILCGYSDITALTNAVYAKTGMVTYSGMHFSTFGQKQLQDYNVNNFKKCLLLDESFTVFSSEKWSDDEWYLDQDNRNITDNEGWWVIHEGKTKGTTLGGNLATFRLLYGTDFMPPFIKDTVLFIEDDNYTTDDVTEFDRNLQALIHQKDFENVSAIVIGRFQVGSKMTRELIVKIVKAKEELSGIPVIANVDFGHTDPMFTFPIGGEVVVDTKEGGSLEFTKH